MKMLMIWHAGGVKSYWKRYEELSKHFNQFTVLVPENWNEGGQIITTKNTVLNEKCKIVTGKAVIKTKDATHIYLRNLKKVLVDEKPDIIMIHEEPWSLVTYQAILLNKLLGINAKIVIDSAAITIHKKPFPFNIVESYVYKNTHLFFARNKEVVSTLRERGAKVPLYLLPNGIDVGKFKREQVNENNKFVIGFIGRIVKEKGIYDLVDAIEIIVNSKFENIELVMVGNGPEKEALQKYINQKMLAKYIHLKDKVDPEKVPEVMNKINLLVLPSRTRPNWKEQFGRVLVEAMACEKVVIGSNSGGIPEVINDNRFIFEEGNFEQLAEKIIAVLRDNNFYYEITKKNLQRVIEMYSWESLGIYVKNVIESEINNGGRVVE